jgi:RNA polymerase sigma-70 factor (ECF subfamily)
MWIRRIAVNRCLAHLRSPWRRLRRELQDADAPDIQPQVEHDRDVLDLQRALEVLPPQARAVVWLHDVEGYSHQEIGRFMHATASYSKSQLVRAYARMRRWADNQSGEKTCTPVLSN